MGAGAAHRHPEHRERSGRQARPATSDHRGLVLLIVTSDGLLYSDESVPDARPLAELGTPVRLTSPPPPGRGWSGAGVKRYLAGERPDPAEVLGRIKSVVDRFIDFDRSLAASEIMCELVACYVIATYLLDAFNVVGYLWPNGDKGCGKTTFLHVVAEMAYLGQVILAGASYASLRDMADYRACLAFDDAEDVMDTRKGDPDKRALLLAGNRRGATVPVKEPAGERGWVTRYVSTFCPRLLGHPPPRRGTRQQDDHCAAGALRRHTTGYSQPRGPRDLAVRPPPISGRRLGIRRDQLDLPA